MFLKIILFFLALHRIGLVLLYFEFEIHTITSQLSPLSNPIRFTYPSC